MSRIGKKPITIPDDVEVKIEGRKVSVKGPRGEMERVFTKENILMKIDGKMLYLTVDKERVSKDILSVWGTYAAHILNMIEGVKTGFSKILIIEGIGFKAQVDGNNLVLNLGFSHPIRMPILEGLEIKVEKNKITVSGIDKELVGETSAKIRALKKPEPYKGKGIRYENEIIRRKAGKKAASSSA